MKEIWGNVLKFVFFVSRKVDVISGLICVGVISISDVLNWRKVVILLENELY